MIWQGQIAGVDAAIDIFKAEKAYPIKKLQEVSHMCYELLKCTINFMINRYCLASYCDQYTELFLDRLPGMQYCHNFSCLAYFLY